MHLSSSWRVLLLLAFSSGFAHRALAADWNNSGGNAGRNGLTSEVGPDSTWWLWWDSGTSLVAWQPVIEGRRVFVVRQTAWPPETTGSPIRCMSLDGTTPPYPWEVNLPAPAGSETTWIAGVRGGRVYASRSGNTGYGKLYCLNASYGTTMWNSQETQNAGPYDGVVFAPNGDPVVAAQQRIWRFNHLNGSTLWSASRTASVSSPCGGAIFGNAFYVCDAVAGGQAIRKFNLETGAFLYQSPTMPGTTVQNTPMVGPDGAIYLSRTQGNAGVDFFYAIADSGSAMSIRWSVPAGYSAYSEFAVGPDGGVYHVAPGNQLHKLDPATGATLATTGSMPLDLGMPRMAVDAWGRVFLSDANAGMLHSFESDLTLRWSLGVGNINTGTPAIGADGTLVVASTGSVKAYRTLRVWRYCTPGTTSHGCVPAMTWTGLPSATAPSGFTIAVSNVEGQQNGVLFYGVNNTGFTPTPWGASSSYLCIKAPFERMGVQGSGGTAGTCTGALMLDWNAYRAANPFALGQPLSAGAHLYAQGWFRDPPSPKSTLLSDGLQFIVQP